TTFVGINRNITDRDPTETQVDWDVPAWTSGDSGADQMTPDLAGVLTEIITRDNWQDGNAIALVIEGTGKRSVYSFDGDPDKAPKLVVTFGTVIPQVAKPVIDPDGGAFVSSVLVDITTATPGATVYYTDDTSEPNMDATACGCPFTLTTDTTIKARAYLDGYTPSDTAEAFFDITPYSSGTTLDLSIGTSSDDAKERASGQMKLTSSDLEMVAVRSGDQTIGLRYTDVAIPPGSTINSAYLQFTSEDSTSGATSLVIRAEATANAPTFTT
ncbi:MAG: hypothetical protein GY724_25665, partial [Actinomycetia bacterium]|nr:hypothetical protein [Actinomycetes bacterium]